MILACLANVASFMKDNEGTVIIAALLTLAALGFSIYGAIYSNITHNIEMADGNARFDLSKNLRKLAIRRAHTANLFYLSLVLTIATLLLYLIAYPGFDNNALMNAYAGTFVVAVVLLIIAAVMVMLPLGKDIRRKCNKPNRFWRCLKKLCRFLLKTLLRVIWPIDTDYLKR